MKQIAAIFLGIVLLSSCAYHSGMMTANLPDDFDQEIIAQANGQATTVHVFGIGGLDHKHLVTDAKKMLYSNYPLKKGEAYANLVIDRHLFPFIVVNVNQIFVTADIVADPSIENDTLQYFFETPLNERGLRILSRNGIWIKANDEVRVVIGQQNGEGRVVRVLGRKKVLVTSPEFGERKYRLNRFYLTDESIRFRDQDFQVGQSVEVEINGSPRMATITGINHRYLLLESGRMSFVRSIRETTKYIEKAK